jgi:hypothetical protein
MHIIFGHQRVRHAGAADGAGARQRRHDDAVLQGEVANDDRVEQVCHVSSCKKCARPGAWGALVGLPVLQIVL